MDIDAWTDWLWLLCLVMSAAFLFNVIIPWAAFGVESPLVDLVAGYLSEAASLGRQWLIL